MKIKKTFYIICTMILGALFAFIVHSLLEIWFIRIILDQKNAPQFYNFFTPGSYLPPQITGFLMMLGLTVGYFTGQAWWRLVYVEFRHWRCNNKKYEKR
jgi:hypothetical protein